MKILRSFAVFSSLALASMAAWAAPSALPTGMVAVPLATITNDRDPSVSYLKLVLGDNGAIRGIYMQTAKDGHEAPKASSGKVYWLKGIESPGGVVLGQGQGVKAIFLHGDIRPLGDHGMLTIRYLTNGVFKHYAKCRIGLRRLGQGQWQLVNAYTGNPVDHIEVQTWMLGISTLTNVCPAEVS